MDYREWLKSVIAGAGAGCTTSLVTCPMDVVKTRLQSQAIPRHANPHAIIIQSMLMSSNGDGNGKKKKPYHNNQSIPPYRGTVPSLKRIFKEEGIRGLYRGLNPTLIGYLPAHAIYFSVYTSAKRLFSTHNIASTGSIYNHVISAICGGAASTTATNPLWVIRTRLMTQTPGRSPFYYSGTIDALTQICEKEGLGGLYKGLGPSLLGVLHVTVQFPLYEMIKHNLLSKSVQPEDNSVLMRNVLIASTLSKVTASLVTYPHEVLRTRLQRECKPVHEAKYKGIAQGAKTIWREEGFFGFYRGLGTSIMRVVPASAVTLLTFELLLHYLPM